MTHTATLGTYPYGTTDGWHPEVLADARSSLGRLASQLCCNAQVHVCVDV